jgi:hypothetical protein
MTEPPRILIQVPPQLSEGAQEAAKKLGLPWEAAECLAEALEMLSHRPCAVITTLNQNGFQLLRTARMYYPKTRVFLLEVPEQQDINER